jgi:hypothetical protein
MEDTSAEKINIIMRQTDYDEDVAKEKLEQFNGDHIKVIKFYFGISEKKPTPIKSVNQEIYKQIRSKLDVSMREYNHLQETKLQSEIEQNKISEN